LDFGISSIFSLETMSAVIRESNLTSSEIQIQIKPFGQATVKADDADFKSHIELIEFHQHFSQNVSALFPSAQAAGDFCSSSSSVSKVPARNTSSSLSSSTSPSTDDTSSDAPADVQFISHQSVDSSQPVRSDTSKINDFLQLIGVYSSGSNFQLCVGLFCAVLSGFGPLAFSFIFGNILDSFAGNGAGLELNCLLAIIVYKPLGIRLLHQPLLAFPFQTDISLFFNGSGLVGFLTSTFQAQLFGVAAEQASNDLRQKLLRSILNQVCLSCDRDQRYCFASSLIF
jgi:hypothetical protein